MSIGEIAPASEIAIGRREGWVILVTLAAILTWGFSGWEYPEIETIGPGATPVAADQGRGAELFQANGCYACHSLEGETIIGPTLRGIYGTTVDLEDGSSVMIDDAYLVESILRPAAKRVAGYGDAAMPSYDGLVSAADAEALADYIKSLR